MASGENAKWRFLLSVEEWAKAKAKAIQQARSTEVLALVHDNDDMCDASVHVFGASTFLQSITRSPEQGSLGMAGM